MGSTLSRLFRNKMFYLIAEELEGCVSDDDIVEMWNSIWDDMIRLHRSFVDNNDVMIPPHERSRMVFGLQQSAQLLKMKEDD